MPNPKSTVRAFPVRQSKATAADELGPLTTRLDSCIGAISMASQVLFEAEGDGQSGHTDAWTTLDLVKAELHRIRDSLSEMDDAQRRTS